MEDVSCPSCRRDHVREDVWKTTLPTVERLLLRPHVYEDICEHVHEYAIVETI